MPKICYVEKNFSDRSLAMIDRANEIIEEYEAGGHDLTLRQLYYQFVARGLLDNKQTEYKRLGSVVNDARLAGLIDWERITDRTRNLREKAHWENPREVLEYWSRHYLEALWDDQPNYVEVWIEKDALVGVIDGVCRRNDVAFFSCRGYTSASELWSAAMRLVERNEAGQDTHVIHLGDHDPSGVDMTRDIDDRLELFMEAHWAAPATVHRIALNMDQVRRYNPPPNPAKITDSRAKGYIARHGRQSWELDALDPKTLDDLISRKIRSLRDDDLWRAAIERQKAGRSRLAELADLEN